MRWMTATTIVLLSACGEPAASERDAGSEADGALDAAAPEAGEVDAGAATVPRCRAYLASLPAEGLPAPTCARLPVTRDMLRATGVGIGPTGEDRYFTAYFPEDWPVDGGLVVYTLHGTDGCPEVALWDWQNAIGDRPYAIVGLSYRDPPEFDPADVVYDNLIALDDTLAASCPLDRATRVLHGFSRGSAELMSHAIDDRADRGLFAAFVADSGGRPPTQPWATPVQRVIDDDRTDAYAGARFWMYCGLLDDSHGVPMCDEMREARTVVEAYGGAVDRLFEDPVGGHGMLLPMDAEERPGVVALLEYLDAL